MLSSSLALSLSLKPFSLDEFCLTVPTALHSESWRICSSNHHATSTSSYLVPLHIKSYFFGVSHRFSRFVLLLASFDCVFASVFHFITSWFCRIEGLWGSKGEIFPLLKLSPNALFAKSSYTWVLSFFLFLLCICIYWFPAN